MSEDLSVLAFARSSLPQALAARLPATAEARAGLLRSLAAAAPERLLLVTCERFELYLVDARDAVRRLAGALEMETAALAAACRVRRGDAAAQHLLRVAAGLESRLVGEPQIQGQVRAAFLEGEAQGAVGPVLSALARAALHAGKRVRCETGIGRAPTLVTLTVARLAEQLQGLRRRSVLVAGTGGLAVEVARALRAAAVGRLLILSRTRARADLLAARLGGVGLIDQDLEPASPRVDAIVSCTNRNVPLAAAWVGECLSIVDLGVPPNVGLEAAGRRGVRLTRLTDLNGDAAAAARPAALRAAERIIGDELRRFQRWLSARTLHTTARVRGEAA